MMKPKARENTPALAERANSDKKEYIEPTNAHTKLVAEDSFDYWTDKFNLNHWFICMLWNNSYGPKGNFGECDIRSVDDRLADIFINTYIDNDEELERTIIHELLHIALWFGVCPPGNQPETWVAGSEHSEWAIRPLEEMLYNAYGYHKRTKKPVRKRTSKSAAAK
jgi:hypothetical protein